MNYKRVTLLCGHYGSGKTNIAVNMALDLRKQYERVAIADIDIVNPYYRTKDSEEILKKAGIRMIASGYANTNVDLPSMPQEIYAIVDDRDLHCVVDVGGDDRGAYALGRLAPKILEENDYDMFLVINRFRPLTPDASSTEEIMHEIERAASLSFTGIIHNSNLAAESSAEDILSSVQYAHDCAALCSLPLFAHCWMPAQVPRLPEAFAEAGLGDEPLFPMEQATKRLF